VNIKQDFLQILKKKFFSQAVPVNFLKKYEVAQDMNNWIEEKTKGKIKNIIRPGKFLE